MLGDINLNELTLDKMGSWPNPIKIAICIFIILIVIFLGYSLDVQYKMDNLDIAQSKELALRQEFETKYARAVSLNAYKEQLREIRVILSKLMNNLPSRAEVPGLLEDISKMGVASGLEFKLFDPQPEIKHDFYSELPIKIIVVGDYHQFGKFVSRVAALERIVTLHDFTIAANKPPQTAVTGGASDTHTNLRPLSMEVIAKTYSYNEEIKKKGVPRAAK